VKKRISYRKYIMLAALLMGSLQLTYAAFSFTGIVDDKTRNNKYSLRSLNNFAKKGLSLNAIKSNLQYRGIQIPSNATTIVNNEVNSMLQYGNGNTTYIYPYKFKVKVPKFKTPQPNR
jgi:hypothetical protein